MMPSKCVVCVNDAFVALVCLRVSGNNYLIFDSTCESDDVYVYGCIYT